MQHPALTSASLPLESASLPLALKLSQRLLGARTAGLCLAIFAFAFPQWAQAGQVLVFEENPQQAISQSLSSELFNPDIAASGFGRYAVTWNDISDIFVRLAGQDGVPIGPAFNPAQTTGNTFARVAMARDGSFVVAWRRVSDNLVLARRFDAAGNPFGSQFQVNDIATPDSVYDLDIGMNDEGFFVITWSSRDAMGLTTVAAKRFDAAGNALGSQFQANTFTGDAATNIAFYPSVAVRPDSQEFFLSWTPVPSADHDVHGRIFAADGSPATPELDINVFTTGEQASPAACFDAGGVITTTWTGNQPSLFNGVSARRFLADGTPLQGDSYLGISGQQYAADITTRNETRVAIAWANDDNTRGIQSTTIQTLIEGFGYFQMNAPDANPQTDPAVAFDDRGVLATAWIANNQTGSGDSIMVRRVLLATVLDQFAQIDYIRGTALQSSWNYYVITVPAGALELTVDLYDLPPVTPNDVDLYVRFDTRPDTSAFECRSFEAGNAPEQCQILNPPPGDYWIGVNSFHPGEIVYKLRATLVEPTLFADGFESGNTSAWSATLP